jgi:hypothetical protein
MRRELGDWPMIRRKAENDATRPRPRKEREQRAIEILRVLQPELMPEHSDDIISINTVTGEYALGKNAAESRQRYRERWPDQPAYTMRVDGRPLVRFGMGTFGDFLAETGASGVIRGRKPMIRQKPATQVVKHRPQRERQRLAMEVLERVQPELMPEHADEIISINVETGEYTLGRDALESGERFHQRWPDELCYQVRVDGGPVARFGVLGRPVV